MSKTEIASFRVDQKTLENLRKDAEANNVSLNNLVNQIFDNYLEWYSVAYKAKFVPLPAEMLQKMIDKLTNEEIKKIADLMAEHEVKSLLMMLRGEYTVQSVISAIKSWARISNFQLRHIENADGTHKYIIQHDMEKKWSLYFGRIFENMLRQVSARDIKIETTDITVIISLRM